MIIFLKYCFLWTFIFPHIVTACLSFQMQVTFQICSHFLLTFPVHFSLQVFWIFSDVKISHDGTYCLMKWNVTSTQRFHLWHLNKGKFLLNKTKTMLNKAFLFYDESDIICGISQVSCKWTGITCFTVLPVYVINNIVK